MEVIAICFTRGDHATLPGGIILRKMDDDEYVAHHFVREYGSKKPTSFFWGHYRDTEDKGRTSYTEKVMRANRYDRGGSLIPDYRLEVELEQELRDHPAKETTS